MISTQLCCECSGNGGGGGGSEKAGEGVWVWKDGGGGGARHSVTLRHKQFKHGRHSVRAPPAAAGSGTVGRWSSEAESACQQDKHDQPLPPPPPLPASASRRPLACPLSVALLGRVCTVTSWRCSRPATWRLQQRVSTTDRHTRQRPSCAAVQQMDSNYGVL